MSEFSAGTIEDQIQGLANLFPNGRAFAAKNIQDTNLRKLIQGLAFEVWRAEKRIEDISIESNLEVTEDLITEWERALGIPDLCFTGTGTLDERRNACLAKLKSRGVATKEAFIALAFFMGYVIEIISLSDVAFPPYDVPFFPTSFPGSRFVWWIRGHDIAPFVPPYNVPFDINVGGDIIPCFFETLKPANTILLFSNI